MGLTTAAVVAAHTHRRGPPSLPFGWGAVTVLLIGAVLTIVGIILILYGMFHYLLWGKMLSEQVAGEREEEQLRQRAEVEEWPVPDPYGVRRG